MTVSAIVPFVPSATSPFQFQATLDGATYNVVVTWNVFGQRYYVNVYDQGGALVICMAMVGSPLDYDISLVPPTFSNKLVWRPASNQFEVIT